jgi:hypothetical protein
MKKILIAVLILFGFQMCNLQKADKPNVELDKEIDVLLVDYKNQLGVEKIDISYSGPYSDLIDSVKMVHVTLFDPPKKADLYPTDLSLEIASEVYKHLINKNDFKGLCINYLYANQGPYMSGQYFFQRHEFLYKEIQDFISKHE